MHPGGYAIKLFSLLMMISRNKLVRLSVSELCLYISCYTKSSCLSQTLELICFQPSLAFMGTTSSLPYSVATFLFGRLLPKSQSLDYKHSSLLQTLVNYGRKKFYGIDTRIIDRNLCVSYLIVDEMHSVSCRFLLFS